jgi:phage shock protein A
MGIFTRFRDIINSNISAMLDKAEDPEKLVKLMIREMEDTLVEIKASCAGVMASRKKVQRMLDEVRSKENYWEDKAKLAVEKGRDDLAREALIEKRKYTRRAESLENELVDLDAIVDQYKDDMVQLEDKLKTANEKRRMLVQRHIRALRKKQAQEEIRRIDSAEALMKFDELENRIERMEIEADLVNCGVKTQLEEELDTLAVDDDIEKQLEALKSPLAEKSDKSL